MHRASELMKGSLYVILLDPHKIPGRKVRIGSFTDLTFTKTKIRNQKGG